MWDETAHWFAKNNFCNDYIRLADEDPTDQRNLNILNVWAGWHCQEHLKDNSYSFHMHGATDKCYHATAGLKVSLEGTRSKISDLAPLCPVKGLDALAVEC